MRQDLKIPDQERWDPGDGRKGTACQQIYSALFWIIYDGTGEADAALDYEMEYLLSGEKNQTVKT